MSAFMNALAKHDIDSDGMISRDEFQKAMAMMAEVRTYVWAFGWWYERE